MLIEVLLPLPVERLFTYSCEPEQGKELVFGSRVAVPFGRQGVRTGVVVGLDVSEPMGYEAREVFDLLDGGPLITVGQWRFWKWIAHYYMCTPGEVMKAALPGGFFLASETRFEWNPENDTDPKDLTDEEYLVWEALQQEKVLDLRSLQKLISSSRPIRFLERLRREGRILAHEQLKERYKPRLKRYLGWHPEKDPDVLRRLLDGDMRAPRQRETVLQFTRLMDPESGLVAAAELAALPGINAGGIRALIQKQIFREEWIPEDRLPSRGGEAQPPMPEAGIGLPEPDNPLSGWDGNPGKPLVYRYATTSSKFAQLSLMIGRALDQGKQVLFIVPELAYIRQVESGLQTFQPLMRTYHARLNAMERVEFWNRCLSEDGPALILGTRTSLFLPLNNTGLIIVDESHDSSYKQFDPAPRYHGRDAGIYLAHTLGVQAVLCSSVPTMETLLNTNTGKYAIWDERTLSDSMSRTPHRLELVNLRDAHMRKRMQGNFAESLIEHIGKTLESDRQVVLFHYRRGYAPVLECGSCGMAVQCPNCDVSMTYHLGGSSLSCHYCGFNRPFPASCEHCGGRQLYSKGVGSEQIEQQLGELFPEASVIRMDQETTRGKKGHQNISDDFRAGKYDIAVGTQMLIKGLDYRNVGLIGVTQADALWNFPDYRSVERAFQLFEQLLNRDESSTVVIQAYNPQHEVLMRLKARDHKGLMETVLQDRRSFNYPPYARLIRITLKAKSEMLVREASDWFARALRTRLPSVDVLGPEPPHVSRVRRWHLRQLMLKVPLDHSYAGIKKGIKRTEVSFYAISKFGSVRFAYDVDHL